MKWSRTKERSSRRGEVEVGADAGGEERGGEQRVGGGVGEGSAEPIGEELGGADEADEGEAVRGDGAGR
jgi:hypothetical protein